MRRHHVLAIAVTLLAATGFGAGTATAAETLYSIQVRAVPLARKADGLSTYRALRDKGYLVYHHAADVDGKSWLRIAVGAFRTTDDAAAFGRDFTAKEGMDHFVARAPVRIVAAAGGAFVVAPSALWTRAGRTVREVFVFDESPPEGFAAPGGIRLMPSPDRTSVAFQYGMRVYAVRLGDETAVQLTAGGPYFGADHDYGPTPRWSPSGRYVAFQDFTEWEVKTSLWVARADGSETRALVDNQRRESQNAVKDFVWHPTEDRIIYVDGYAYGTVSVGGAIRSVDMAGQIVTVLDNDRKARQELAGPLRIADGHLHYRIVQFDANYERRSYTDARVPLADLRLEP